MRKPRARPKGTAVIGQLLSERAMVLRHLFGETGVVAVVEVEPLRGDRAQLRCRVAGAHRRAPHLSPFRRIGVERRANLFQLAHNSYGRLGGFLRVHLVHADARLNQPDGIHPNAKGQAVIADRVWPYLRPLLSTSRPR